MTIGRERREDPPTSEDSAIAAFVGYVLLGEGDRPYGWWWSRPSADDSHREQAKRFLDRLRVAGLTFELVGAGATPVRAADAYTAVTEATMKVAGLDLDAAAGRVAPMLRRLLNSGIALGHQDAAPASPPPQITRLLLLHDGAVRRWAAARDDAKRKAASERYYEEKGKAREGQPYLPTYGDDSWREQE